ncbi:MAG: TldD/PmbA family protein [Alphaproteobacteria bacterium]|nr:TldD/PmbA family protein [Alphaproteobacteria bacterium]
MTISALETLDTLMKLSLKAGADSADAILIDAASLSVSMRLGNLENLERAESGDLGLRVFVGKKQAIVSSTERDANKLQELAERAVAMARLAPEDQYCGIASPEEIAKEYPKLENADTREFSAEGLIARVREVEEAALAVKGVTNSAGAEAGCGSTCITIAATNGFSGTEVRSGYSLGASVLAGTGTAMERDYEAASRVFADDLPSPAWVGRRAGERAVARLNPRKMPSARIPVVYDPRISNNILGSLIGAISGASVARGTSFLKDMLGQKIFSEKIVVVDDPHRPRGLRSRAFDAEGLLPTRRKLVDAGVLTTWLLDLRSARQLKMQSTGHAARSTGGPPSPSPTNVYMEPGVASPKDLMSDIAEGFYVTETMGMGVNGVTGDYSQAAAGFWIERGQIVFPVNEMTIAGNLKDMFLNLTAANDLEFNYGINAPTVRIEGMTVAGT